MRNIHKKTEFLFERFTSVALKVFGRSITFILALLIVIVYLFSTPFYKQSFHDSIYEIILCFTFLGFFVIQKSFNKSSAALNLKINELLSSHEDASNRLVNIENKSEAELNILTQHYSELGEAAEKDGNLLTVKSIENILERIKEEETEKRETGETNSVSE